MSEQTPIIFRLAESEMRRTNWKTVSTLVTMIVVSGCQDSSAPALSSSSVAPMMLAPAGRPSLSLSGGASGNTSNDFTVSPNGGVYFAGNHAVVFPAGSVCDPVTSSYGPGTWDQPCTTITSALRVHAEVRTANGRSWVDFTPALRFAPTNDASQYVWMFMYAPGAVNARGDLSRFNILYAASIGGSTIDESAMDSSMRTYVDTRSGISARRIKHFSGYTSSSGRACDPTVDLTDCFPDPNGT